MQREGGAHTRAVDRAIETAGAVVLAYSPLQAAAVSSLSVRKLMTDMKTGRLKSYLKGRRRVILRRDLIEYLTD